VIGYGTQRKEAVTGSVATVKGDAFVKCLLQHYPGIARTAGVIFTNSTKPELPCRSVSEEQDLYRR
jgi:hypothetical protein